MPHSDRSDDSDRPSLARHAAGPLAVATVLVALALAGCAGTNDHGWRPMACDSSGARHVSGDAPPVIGLQGTEATIAGNVARALSDPLAGPSGPHAWTTQRGALFVDPDSGAVRYSRHGALTFNALDVKSALGSLGTDPASLSAQGSGETQGLVVQGYNGTTVARIAWTFDRQHAEAFMEIVTPPRDFSGVAVRVSDKEALALAAKAEACAVDSGQRPAGAPTDIAAQGWSVSFESVGRDVVATYPTPDGHCQTQRWTTTIDAETGALLGVHASECV